MNKDQRARAILIMALALSQQEEPTPPAPDPPPVVKPAHRHVQPRARPRIAQPIRWYAPAYRQPIRMPVPFRSAQACVGPG